MLLPTVFNIGKSAKNKLRGTYRAIGFHAVVGFCTLLVILAGCAGNTAASPIPQSPTTLPKGAGSATPPALQTTDWLTYHRNNTRTGYVADAPDPQHLTRAWNTQLDGAVYAEPLVVNGKVIIATEGGSLYSLDANSGQIQWHTKVGAPQDQTQLPCGDINPLGITSTPAYDPRTGLIFSVAEVSGPKHVLVGVDAQTGQVKVRRAADPDSIDPTPYQQRAALLVANGYVYWAFGGLTGDCGNYKGTVMASSTDGQGPLLSYVVPTPREGGIWSTPGPSVDSQGNIYVTVGNGAQTSGDWDKSDSVLRLSPTLKYEDGFAPGQWQQDNSSDADLGSLGPVLLPNGLIFIAGKSSTGYTLHANALGGVGGQIQQAPVCNGLAMGGAASANMTVIVPCTGGLQQLQIGNDGSMHKGWSSNKAPSLSPVIGGHTVYSLGSDGTLYALNLDNGSTRAQINLQIASLPHFASPTLSGNHIYVGSDTGVVAVTLA